MKADPEIADRICLRMTEGESLKAICSDEGMPNRSTVFRWLASDEEFRRKYEIARQMMADLLFDEIKDIADDGSNDWMQRRLGDGSAEQVVDHENIQRSRLRVDTRKWMAAKLLPRKYGDRIGVDVTASIDRAAELAAARRRVHELGRGNPNASEMPLLPAPEADPLIHD